jgi:hypothetical protein
MPRVKYQRDNNRSDEPQLDSDLELEEELEEIRRQVDSKKNNKMKAGTIWTWVKILVVLGGLLAFAVTSVVLYYKYNDFFDVEDSEDLKPKTLTPAAIYNSTNMAQYQKASAFLTRIMEKEKTLDSLLDNYDRLEKGGALPHGKS